MGKLAYAVLAILVAAGVAVAYYWWLRPAELAPPAPEPPPVASAPAAPPAEPAIRHPVEPGSDAPPLPALDQSDDAVKAALNGLLGPKAVLGFLRTESFVRPNFFG